MLKISKKTTDTSLEKMLGNDFPVKLDRLNRNINAIISSWPKIDWRDPESQEIDIIRGIVLEGFQKKFCLLDSDLQDKLHLSALTDWIAKDQSLKHPSGAEPWSSLSATTVGKIQARIRGILRGFKVNFDDAWPGPGESFFSSQGNISPVGKFSALYSVTPECRSLFRSICVSNKHIAMELLEQANDPVSSEQFPLNAHYRAALDNAFDNIVVEIAGNRFETVPKNNDARRPICVEPLGNVMAQRMIGRAVRRCLSGVNDLDSGAERHQRMLLESNAYATIDLSGASDSISLDMVRFLIGESELFDLMSIARSPYTYLEVEGKKYWLKQHKLSSMGNGFTFEVMSLLLYATLSAGLGTRDVSVFGDDIIVPKPLYSKAIQLVEALGFTINYDKSFCGKITESCGVYALDVSSSEEELELVDIPRYDFRAMEHILDAILFSNKIHYLVGGIRKLGYTFPELHTMDYIRRSIIEIVPEDLRGPSADILNRNEFGSLQIPNWLISDEGLKRTQSNLLFERATQRVEPTFTVLAVEYQPDLFTVDFGPLALMEGLRSLRAPTWWRRGENVLKLRSYIVSAAGEVVISRREFSKLYAGVNDIPGYPTLALISTCQERISRLDQDLRPKGNRIPLSLQDLDAWREMKDAPIRTFFSQRVRYHVATPEIGDLIQLSEEEDKLLAVTRALSRARATQMDISPSKRSTTKGVKPKASSGKAASAAPKKQVDRGGQPNRSSRKGASTKKSNNPKKGR
uniref:RNA-directed RNA polymerase n=1 Tax=Charcot virus TaxID=2707204 RepID=A0A6H0DIL1_9VIRU|nr:MAG: RNA-dependent RNA polymerase [Charcot virus]